MYKKDIYVYENNEKKKKIIKSYQISKINPKSLFLFVSWNDGIDQVEGSRSCSVQNGWQAINIYTYRYNLCTQTRSAKIKMKSKQKQRKKKWMRERERERV